MQAPRQSKKLQNILDSLIGIPSNKVTFRVSKKAKDIQALLRYQNSRFSR